MAEQMDDAVAGFTADLGPDAWEHEPHRAGLVSRLCAEALGTFALVFIGLAIPVFSAQGDILLVALGFGAVVAGVVVTLSAWSGGHINPAVTVGVWLAGRFPGKDVAPYIVAQVIGALVGGGTLVIAASSHPSAPDLRLLMDSVSIGYGEFSPSSFPFEAGFMVEILATATLVAVVLGATSVKVPQAQAPFTIGGTVALLVIFAVPFTNASLNPARATGSAIFANTWAVQQLWVWWLTAMIAAALTGLLFRAFGPEEDLIEIVAVDAEVVED